MKATQGLCPGHCGFCFERSSNNSLCILLSFKLDNFPLRVHHSERSITEIAVIKWYPLACNLRWCSQKPSQDPVCSASPDSSHLGRRNKCETANAPQQEGTVQFFNRFFFFLHKTQIVPSVKIQTYMDEYWENDSSVCCQAGGPHSSSALDQLQWGSVRQWAVRSIVERSRVT